jgi:hypothetical protein
MHKISFTKEALFDIELVVLWYEEQRIGLSYDFELCLEAGIAEISRNPENFQKIANDIMYFFIIISKLKATAESKIFILLLITL